ncbi:formate dehydrogenase accessory sulfurtransferase FdhD [Virgibacillus sp. W0430]|uniref:formate dehydrogenase accessory sulfurtransferase FdhD n=1 Tax=Virgibacillus sp. W0430 TaxID=3391580 RepID=UPI003F4540B3
MTENVHVNWKTVQINSGSRTTLNDHVATEYPLTIYLNGKEFATIVCTPTDLQDMIIGFLASEGIILFADEITDLTIDRDRGFAHVTIRKSLEDYEHDHSKRFIGSCCGKSRQFYFKSDVKTAKTITSKMKVTASECFSLMKKMQTASTHFRDTGGVHNAALCTRDQLITIRTDIGRHNALDKIYGHILAQRIPLHDKLIVFSGRISSEALLKAAKIGTGIVVSKSAPTDLALKLAEDLGITAIGFVRKEKMNIYTHPYRIRNDLS